VSKRYKRRWFVETDLLWGASYRAMIRPHIVVPLALVLLLATGCQQRTNGSIALTTQPELPPGRSILARLLTKVSSGFTRERSSSTPASRSSRTTRCTVGRRNATGKVVGSFVDDSEGRELYLGHVRQDRCAMWVRTPDEENVPKALRALADHNYVHTRYYGSGQQTDFNVS
jgi:hypothetical protein